MKIEQYLAVIAAALLFIGLIFSAGLYYRSDWLIRFAVLISASMYATQAADAIRAEYVGSPAAAFAGGVVVVAWAFAIVLSGVAIVIILTL